MWKWKPREVVCHLAVPAESWRLNLELKALIITLYNRPTYLTQNLQGLKENCQQGQFTRELGKKGSGSGLGVREPRTRNQSHLSSLYDEG